MKLGEMEALIRESMPDGPERRILLSGLGDLTEGLNVTLGWLLSITGYEYEGADDEEKWIRRDESVKPNMIKQEGQACRKCGTAVVKKTPKNKKKRLKQAYYYEWYLYCPGCDTMYMVNEAKRFNMDRPSLDAHIARFSAPTELLR